MRKRILIGAMAAAMIAVAGYLLSLPTKRSVEYHRQEYLKSRQPGLIETWHNRWNVGLGKDRSWTHAKRRTERGARHRAALVELGYLEQRTLVLTNHVPVDLPWRDAMARAGKTIPKQRLEFFTFKTHMQSITLMAPPEDMDTWDKLVKEMDAAP
jgi:hypothetical protein